MGDYIEYHLLGPTLLQPALSVICKREKILVGLDSRNDSASVQLSIMQSVTKVMRFGREHWQAISTRLQFTRGTVSYKHCFYSNISINETTDLSGWDGWAPLPHMLRGCQRD